MPNKKITFKPFVVRSGCCDSILLLIRPKIYLTCKCGNTSIDAGDGYYMRTNIVEGTPLPIYYRQPKKGSYVMVARPKKKTSTKTQ